MNNFVRITGDPREPEPHQNQTARVLAPVMPDGLADADAHADPPQQTLNRQLAPSITVERTRINDLHAVSVSIAARIRGDIAEVTATHVFWNDTGSPILQGSYTFAFPNNCTIMGFTSRIGNHRVLKAVAHPKSEGREAFQRAVASHIPAALLEQNTSEIFTSSLGYIPPNTRIKTEIRYAMILKRTLGNDISTTTLVIPTYIAQKYGERPASLQGLNLEAKPNDVFLHIEILESKKIESIKSTSHAVLVDRGTGVGHADRWDQIDQGSNETTIVTMREPSGWLETDFILSMEATCGKEIENPEAWLEMHPTLQDQAAIMLTLPPRALHSHCDIAKNGEILLVVDRSGSMEDKMTNLKSAMHSFLKGIPVGRTLNIWCFGSHCQPLWAKSQVYGPETLQQALQFVNNKFNADMGGTEILPTLEAIINARDQFQPTDVVILTDGQIWRPDETMTLVRKAHISSRGAIRFFSLGLGAHVSRTFVDGIAKEGGGYSEIIARVHQDGLENEVVRMLRAALTDHAHNIRIDTCGLRAMMSPDNLESMNPFTANRVFLLVERGKIPELGDWTLKLSFNGVDMPITMSVTKIPELCTLLHTLAASSILHDIELATKIWPETWSGAGYSVGNLSQIAEDLACKYSLPSQWTSLFLSQDYDDDEQSEHSAIHGLFSEIVTSRGTDSLLQTRAASAHSGQREMGSGEPYHFVDANIRVDRDPRDGTEVQYQASTLPDAPISLILNHQAFNGSFAASVLDELPRGAPVIFHIIKQWLREKTGPILTEKTIDLVASTALTAALLERDFQDVKDLWIMIWEKAMMYIRLHISQPNLDQRIMEFSRAILKC
ncbi:von Willebrand factor type A domain-containing protein [Nemania sp. FL0916]|nr:von Willebrand factor type A domain-containing protein [Nemania sp. FL0916]